MPGQSGSHRTDSMPGHYSRIFLLSHMRAFTSLAGHILGSHPRINGYYEMHISYDDASALARQLEVYRRHDPLKANSHYLFDKLLHNRYRLDPGQLDPARTRLLVSLREPEPAIQSIADLFAGKQTGERYASPAEASRYYIARLEWIAGFCRSTGLPYDYYDAELFRAAPDRLLGRLTGWLELDSPLSPHYQRFSQTGEARKGDTSGFILSGKIESIRTDYSHIEIPDDALHRAKQTYRDCRSAIINHAKDSAIIHDPGDRRSGQAH